MAITVQMRTQVSQLYVALFGRAPDGDGLAFWVGRLDTLGGTAAAMTQIANDMFATAPARAYFPLFLTNREIISSFYVNVLGRAADTGGLDFWTAKLDARGATPGSVITEMISAVVSFPSSGSAEGVTSRDLFNNKVTVAQAYGEKNLGVTNATSILSGVTASTATVTSAINLINTNNGAPIGTGGQTFTLTTGTDSGAAYTGSAGNDVFTAGDVAGVTSWTTGDAIDGGAGNDVFNVVSNAAITTPTAATVTNIETANLTSGGAVNVTTTGWTGLTSLNVTSVGGATQAITAAATTAVAATSSAVNAAETINGGSTVSVTNTGVTAAGTLAIGGTTAAAGAVTVNSTSSTVDTTVQGTITVTGGTTVTVNQIAGNAVNTTTTAGAVTVTGNASTTAVTVTNSTPATAAATVVGRVNGAVTITDGNATTASDTISTVTLTNYGNSTVASNVLSTVNLTGATTASGTLALNTTAADTSVRATTLNLNLGGGSLGAITGTQADLYTTVNVTSSANTTVADQSFAAATTLNVGGTGVTTFTANTGLGAVTAINSTGGGLSLGTALGTGVTFTGGAGVETVSLGATTKAINMGGGNDRVTSAGTVGTGGSVNAGDGVDTIVMTSTDAAAASANGTFNTKFSNFEVVELSNALAANDTVNLVGLNGASQITLTAGGANATNSVIAGLASGGTVKQTGAGTGVVVQVANAAFNAADVLNVQLSNTAITAFGQFTAANVETVNISAPDASTAATGSAAVIHTATLVATAATTVNVSGNNGLNLTNAGNTAITRFDASGVVANGTADTAANLKVTFGSANNTATATVTIIGGAGADALSGNAAKDSITGGAGADVMQGQVGQDTIVAGNGRDVIKIASNSDATDGVFSDSTTAAPDVVNGFVLATAFTSTDFTGTNFQSATAGGANLSMLSIDLTQDNGGAGAGNNLVVAIEANGTGAGQAAGVTYTVTNGILTLSGTGAANVTTLGGWLAEAAAVSATNGETVAFVFGGDTYVFAQNAAQDVLVQLVGVSATSLVLASATTAASAGAVIIGDGLF